MLVTSIFVDCLLDISETSLFLSVLAAQVHFFVYGSLQGDDPA